MIADQCKPIDAIIHDLPAGSTYQLLKGVELQKALNAYASSIGERPEADRVLLIGLPDGRTVLAVVRNYAGCEAAIYADPNEIRGLRRFLFGDGA